jgi:hypothetical protein
MPTGTRADTSPSADIASRTNGVDASISLREAIEQQSVPRPVVVDVDIRSTAPSSGPVEEADGVLVAVAHVSVDDDYYFGVAMARSDRREE